MSSEKELAARLDEDEAVAQAACGNSDDPAVRAAGGRWALRDHPSNSAMIRDENGDVVVYNEGSPTDEEAFHIARHDPARVLRFVDAARAIIRESSGDGHGWAEHEPSYYAGLGYAVTLLAEVYNED